MPLSRAALRRTLRVNNTRLGETLAALEARGLLERSVKGWTLALPQSDQARRLQAGDQSTPTGAKTPLWPFCVPNRSACSAPGARSERNRW